MGVLDIDNGDAAIFAQTNIAIWVLTASSGIFLVVRLWCRYRFSKLWWDDALLAWSWVCRRNTPDLLLLHQLIVGHRSSCSSPPPC